MKKYGVPNIIPTGTILANDIFVFYAFFKRELKVIRGESLGFSVQIKRTPGPTPLTHFPGRGEGGPARSLSGSKR